MDSLEKTEKRTADVSAIVCAYTEERWQQLLQAVASLERQTLPPLEVIIVIDSNPSLFARAKAYFHKAVVIENRDHQGLSGARNSGIALARGSFIAFLDDDAIAESHWLALLRGHCADPMVLGVGGIVEPVWSERHPPWFPHEFSWVIGCSYQVPTQVTSVRNPFGGCMCLRRELFEVLGGFRNDIGRVGAQPMGGEETELCIRAHQHWPHKLFLCEPRARIHHHVSPQRAGWRYFYSRCYAEGLSKAHITSYVGTQASLVSEYTYTLSVLPRGVLQGLYDGCLRLDATGFLRAGVIITGLTTTALGYLVGRIKQRSTLQARQVMNVSQVVQEEFMSGMKDMKHTKDTKDTKDTTPCLLIREMVGSKGNSGR